MTLWASFHFSSKIFFQNIDNESLISLTITFLRSHFWKIWVTQIKGWIVFTVRILSYTKLFLEIISLLKSINEKEPNGPTFKVSQNSFGTEMSIVWPRQQSFLNHISLQGKDLEEKLFFHIIESFLQTNHNDILWLIQHI